MRLKFLDSAHAKAPPLWLFKPLTHPLDLLLTASVRRLARQRPEVFRRLGRFQHSIFVIAPDDLPFAFRLSPTAATGTIETVARAYRGPFTVRISGKLRTLIGLFDGSVDADSSFFSRNIKMEGATDAALALHNALEAAELRASDILGLPAQLRAPFDRCFAVMHAGLRHDQT